MSDRIPVFVYANDPISQAGMTAQLRGRPEVRVVDEAEVDQAAVAVVVCDDVDDPTIRVVRACQRNGCPRVVLVITRIDEAAFLQAVEAGACGLVRRPQASTDNLVGAIVGAAAGDGSVPPDLLGRLLAHVGRLHREVLQPRGLTFSGLSEREIDVLKLVAEGLSTEEIARRLSYSERTIKNAIHDVMARLHLRNRSHAVAYALKEGLI